MTEKVVHYYTAAWCAPCKNLKPIAKRIAEEAGAHFVEWDIDSDFKEAVLEIKGVPTVYVAEGGEIVAILSPDMVNAAALRKALA